MSTFPEDLGEQSEPALFLGEVAVTGGKAEEAEGWLKLAAARSPERAEARYMLGAALLARGRPQDAAPQPRSGRG